MKRILSVMVSLALIAVSLYICAPISADSSAVANELVGSFGAGEENLIWSDDFSTSAITERVTVVPSYQSHVKNYGVSDGKWNIAAKDGNDLALNGGWLGMGVDDFVASFEFTTKQGWGQSSFYYHSASGMPDQYAYRLYIVGGAGYKATVTLEKKGDSSVRDSVSGFDLPINTEFNIVIVSKGSTDAAYIWKKGGEIPAEPTVKITTTEAVSGDMYYYTYQDNIALDNICVYELSEMSTQAMEIATGLELVDKAPLYANNFNIGEEAPVGHFDAYTGTSEIVDKKWQTTGRIGTSGGLMGQSVKNFAAGFQFSVSDASNGFYADFAYHSSTGWANLNNDNRLNVFGQGDKLTFVLNGKSGVSGYVATEYGEGDLINVVLTYIDKQVSAYIWKCGEAIPTEPTVTVTATEESEGDFYFHLSGATYTLDNFFIYDTADTRLYPEHISAATGLELSEEELLYKNDFSTDLNAPVKSFDAYEGSSKIVNRKWQTTGRIGTSGGLIGQSVINFVAGFQFSVSDAASGFYADFAYHSSTGWANLNNDNRLNVFGQGDKLTFVLNGKSGVSGYAATEYGEGDLINVVLTYIEKQVSAYIWKCGEAIPTEPTITVTATEETEGDLYFHLSGATYEMDNFYVYGVTPEVKEEDTIGLTTEDIKAVTATDFSDTDLIYRNNLSDTDAAPPESFDVYNGTSAVIDGDWVTTGQVGTSKGLTGETLNNFTFGFSFSVSDITSSSVYADFAYHSSTGWANLNADNRLNMFVQNGKLAFVLSAKEGQSRSVLTEYTEGDILNVIMSYDEGDIKAYIWKQGEALPDAPKLKIKGTVLSEGDLYFHLSGATFKMDDLYVYKNPEKAEDEFVTEDKLLIDNSFDKKDDLLFAPTDSGITSVKNGLFEFNTDGHKMLYSPLLASGEQAKDFSWQFTYIPTERTWNTDRFKFHCQGDEDSDSVYLQIIGDGNAKDGDNIQLVRVLNNKAYVLDSAKVAINRANGYTARIISEDNNISVYWWKVGSSTPSEPLLTAESADVILDKGGFMIEGFHTVFHIDDMRLYNYASGKQLTTYLPELPQSVIVAYWNFNSLYGKTDFPFEAGSSLKYWQNTLKIETPMKPERKQITTTNLVGDYELSDLTWEFDIREFESWAIDKFIIHSLDGTSSNSVYLLFSGNAAKTLQGGYNGNDPSKSTLRLIQVIDDKATVLGVYDEETARGKGYSVKITCKDNNIDVWFGAKRTGTVKKVISAKADDRLSKGQLLIESFNSELWLDNVRIYNCAENTDKVYKESLYATVK